MNNDHVRHTATLLSNGQVLIVGGYGDGSITEIYDPVTESWHNTGALNQERARHTSTLLPDGSVLVAGGGNNAKALLATAEIYDLATGVWNYTGSMDHARANHTATLLPDGTVLVVGGSIESTNENNFDIWAPITMTERYNPVTKQWMPSASMQHARHYHTATPLPDGRVLVAGGGASEIYDPETNTWTMALPMNINRFHHTAILLPGGEVLVVGGLVQDDILDIPEMLSSAEILDPFAAAPSWTPVPLSMRQPRANHRATLLPNNKVLIAGGGGEVSSMSAELYDGGQDFVYVSPAQNTFELFNQTYSEHLARGDWLIPQGRDYRTAFHAELGGPASVTISDTLAAYHDGGYAYLTMAENSYYAALQRAADITETHQALMGLLDTRWEQASGAMLSGNEFMVGALDIIYTSPTSPLDEEIGQLEEAVDWYTLATDGYIELLATERFTQFMALQPARVHPVSNRPTPYLDLQRLALASAKKSRAYLEIAERQFRKFTAASKDEAEATLRAALPIAISEFKLLHDVWPDAGADASVQALRRNISDMQRLHRYLQEGKNPFGYGPAYVPFHFQPKHWPNNNFEQTMDLAQAELAVARDLVNYAQGRQEESDDNYAILQQRLYDVSVQYDNQLAQLCGTNAVGEPDLDGCHKNESGEFYRQLLRVEAASKRIDLVEQQMANQLALIEIEEARVAKVNNIHRATAEMYTQTGEKLANLATEEAKLRRQQVRIQNRMRENTEKLRQTESFINAATSMLNPNPVAAISGIIGFVGRISSSPPDEGEALENIETKLGNLNAKRERLRAFQSAYVQYAQADINTANSEATIKQYYLRFAEYDIELNIAMNNLQQAASQLNGLLTQIEYLMAEKAKAEAFTTALYQDPAGRVLRDYYMELASDRFDVALRYAWQAGRALEYELNQDVRFDGGPLTDLDSLYRLRDVYSLEAALAQMNTAYHDFLARTDVPSPQQREDVIYLSQALGFEDAYDPDLGRIVTREEKFNAFVRDPANRDAAGNLRFTFPTAIHLGNQSFSTAVFNDKIVSVKMRLWGNNLGDDRAVIHLKQDGTSFIRTLDAFSEAEYVQTPAGETVCTPVDSVREYNIHPLKASVMAATNLNTLPADVAVNQELATRSVAFTNWTLTLDVVNEPNNFDVDIDNIEEIELIVTHEAYTLQHDNPCGSTTSATTARTPETLRSFFAEATATEIQPTLAAPWGARFEPPENRGYVGIGE